MKYKKTRLLKNPKYRVAFTVIAVIILAVTYFIGERMIKIPEGELQVHFIDVGQGDSALLITNEGTVLIDCGTRDAGYTVASYVKDRTDTVDYLILTHPHEDHIGGAVAVFDAVKVKNVIMPDRVADTATFDRLLDSIEKSSADVISAVSGDKYNVGDLSMTILSPDDPDKYEDTNNVSIVLKADFGRCSFMFTGDAETLVEEDIMKSSLPLSLKCDVLKVSHHGSSTSSSVDFLKRVSPEIAVISCGEDNSYGHPHREVIHRLEDMGARTFRTDRDGTVVITCDGERVLKK